MNKWYKNAVIYQIYPQSFKDTNNDGIGDIPGIIEKLAYLQYLGVDAIWISPMYDSPNFDNGYDVRSYYKLQEKYGTLTDFDHLIYEAHKKNIKVIMDLVINHTSHENPWFLESASGMDNPKKDWYIWRNPKKDGSAPTNWQAIFGGSCWTYCEARKQYYFHTFSSYQPDLNWECEEMKKALFEMVQWWIDRGVDGFRLDAINFISKDEFKDGILKNKQFADIYPFVANKPKVHIYLNELKKKCFLPNNIMTVGEASSAKVSDALQFSKSLDMIFQFEHLALDVHPTIPWKSKKINLLELKETMEKWQISLHNKAWNAIFWENHDQPRVVTRLGDEGIYREKSAKMLAICLYFMEGTPFLYQGQELGCVNTRFHHFSECRDIEVKNAFEEYVGKGIYSEDEMLQMISRRSRDTARTPMQWNDLPYAGFSTHEPWIKINDRYKEINVAEQIKREDSCLNFYKKVFALRKKLSVVANGTFQLIEPFDSNIFAYTRDDRNHKLLVICNYTARSIDFPLSLSGNEKVLLTNTLESTFLSNYVLSPYEGLVIQLK